MTPRKRSLTSVGALFLFLAAASAALPLVDRSALAQVDSTWIAQSSPSKPSIGDLIVKLVKSTVFAGVLVAAVLAAIVVLLVLWRRGRDEATEQLTKYLRKNRGWHTTEDCWRAIRRPSGTVSVILRRLLEHGRIERRNAPERATEAEWRWRAKR